MNADLVVGAFGLNTGMLEKVKENGELAISLPKPLELARQRFM